MIRTRWRRSRFSATTRRPVRSAGAVQSRVFSVGNGVLWAEAGVGAAATQAIVDVSYGPKALALLKAGMTPSAILTAIWASDPDPQPERWTKQGRQFAVINQQGEVAAFTGAEGHRLGGSPSGDVLHRPGQHPRGRSRRERDGAGLRGHEPAISRAPDGGARSRSGRRRRQARHAVGGDSHRREGPGRVAEQRRRHAAAGRRQRRTDQGAAPARRRLERAPRRRGSSAR